MLALLSSIGKALKEKKIPFLFQHKLNWTSFVKLPLKNSYNNLKKKSHSFKHHPTTHTPFLMNFIFHPFILHYLKFFFALFIIEIFSLKIEQRHRNFCCYSRIELQKKHRMNIRLHYGKNIIFFRIIIKIDEEKL